MVIGYDLVVKLQYHHQTLISKMALLLLPSELLEEIFQFLPGDALVQAQRVCKHWYRVICNVNRSRDIWKRRCLEEIPPEILMEMTGVQEYQKFCTRKSVKTRISDGSESFKSTRPELFIGHTRIVPVDAAFWKSLYEKWYRTRFVGKWPQLQLETQQEMMPRTTCRSVTITCVKITGLFIFTGNNYGQVVQWCLSGTFVRVVCHHLRPVTDMTLSKSVDYYRRRSEDPTYSHDTLISVSKDRTLHVAHPLSQLDTCMGSTITTWHSSALNAISTWEHIFVIASDDKQLSVWKIFPPVDNRVEVAQQCLLRGHEASVKTVSIWKNTVMSGSDDGSVRIWNAATAACLFVFHFGTWLSNVILRGNIGICSVGGLSCNIVVIEPENGVYQRIGVIRQLMSCNSHLSMHGDILAIGNNAGQVQLLKVDFQKMRQLVRMKQRARSSREPVLEDADDVQDESEEYICDWSSYCSSTSNQSLPNLHHQDDYLDPSASCHDNGVEENLSIEKEEGDKDNICCLDQDLNCSFPELFKPLHILNTRADYVTSVDIDDDGEGPVMAVSTNESEMLIYSWCSPSYWIQ
ncbi:F-box/WD repeat-containing protein 7-like [Ptychodera flava]|uniref:F-box/WD repeat-containing protein 7-like n=1 Tax=Ptychodera flava TaxID=63121 RepID=UPI00396A6D8C